MNSDLIKYAIIIVLFSGYTGAIFYGGMEYSENQTSQGMVIQAQQNAIKLQDAITESTNKTRALYEKRIKAITDTKPLPDKCVLSPEFQMRHDNAVGMPKSATAHSVSAQAVAKTVEENYFNCRQNIIWLEECQSICK